MEDLNSGLSDSGALLFSLDHTASVVGLPRWLSGEESACQTGDLGSIPGAGRSSGEGNGNHSSILAWEIPWTEEPGGLQSMGLQSQMGLSD